jgi:dienelactone hydrolase
MLRALLVTALLTASTTAIAAVQTKAVTYKQGDTTLEGYLAWDDASTGKRPGVLVVHQWMGLTQNERMRAEMLARLGYVAFAADIYGKGVRPTTPQEAGVLAGKYKGDRALYRARLKAGLDELLANPMVDAARVAAIGYCFGGTGALELARSGAAVAGVVSFHGALDTPTPEDAKNIKAKVLVLHGADDPYAGIDQVAALEKEMRAGGVDYEVVLYGGAVHAFTQKEAGNDNSKGAAYNEKADRRSWQAMQDFFAEIFR